MFIKFTPFIIYSAWYYNLEIIEKHKKYDDQSERYIFIIHLLINLVRKTLNTRRSLQSFIRTEYRNVVLIVTWENFETLEDARSATIS